MSLLPTPRFAVCSMSLGTALYHDLPTKIRVASELGYDGIEMFVPDFEGFVAEVTRGEHKYLFPVSFSTSSNQAALEQACATAIYQLCSSYRLAIPILQPFRDFENFSSEDALRNALDAAERWLSLMPYFHTSLMLVCSNFIAGPHPITGSNGTSIDAYLDQQVRAFTLLGERAAKYGVCVGYEPLAWGTVVDKWSTVWDVVKRVDLPNVGIILDSFNTLGNQYADPSHPTCIRQRPLSDLTENMELLAQTIPGDKIFFYQIADAHRPPVPVEEKPDAPARMTWSRASRLFPCEEEHEVPMPRSFESISSKVGHAGFLPVVEMTKAVSAAGYTGWWSLEVFNTSLVDSDPACLHNHGQRGIRGLRRLWDKSRLGNGQEPSSPLLEGATSSSDGEEDTDCSASSEERKEESSTVTSPSGWACWPLDFYKHLQVQS